MRNRGMVASAQGAPAEAWLRTAIRLRAAVGMPVVRVLLSLSDNALSRGRLEDARQLLPQALPGSQATPSAAYARCLAAEVAIRSEATSEALAHLTEASRLLGERREAGLLATLKRSRSAAHIPGLHVLLDDLLRRSTPLQGV